MIVKYDKNNNPIRIPETTVTLDDKWRKEFATYFRKKYGSWWIFAGVPLRKKKQWITQFRKKGV